jgi:hypothetical protein
MNVQYIYNNPMPLLKGKYRQTNPSLRVFTIALIGFKLLQKTGDERLKHKIMNVQYIYNNPLPLLKRKYR